MTIYAIGDIQGCARALQKLLKKIRFDAAADRLWLTGDLVNRGPHSLQTLRLVQQLGDAVVVVLGNHDLHLLALAAGARGLREDDTMSDVLRAPDCDELLEWLRTRPLMHCETVGGVKTLMVHAGIYPGWRRRETLQYAREVEALLRGDECDEYLRRMYKPGEKSWRECDGKWKRARFITNALTRIRFCNRDGEMDFAHKGPPTSRSAELLPWFEHPDLRCKKWRIVFGHWSALGFFSRGNLRGLDSGCVWGRALTALRLDGEERVWRVKCDA